MVSIIIDIANDKDAASASLLESSNSSSSGKKSILFFWAEWHAPSNSGGPFDMVLKTLAEQNDGSVQFYRVLAEEAPKLSRKVSMRCEYCSVLLFIDVCLSLVVSGLPLPHNIYTHYHFLYMPIHNARYIIAQCNSSSYFSIYQH